jgi:UDP-2,3-diacylglucosamine hydrolase
MRVIITSDLHISGSEDPLYDSLLRLISEAPKTGDILVLAGDVFDFFVGNKELLTSRYSSFISTLKSAGERGVQLHYIEGNHDFHLKKAFREIQGLTIHEADVALNCWGKRFYIAHGDLVDLKDYKYRALRGFFRSPVMKAFVSLAPGKWVDLIGSKSSEASRKKGPRLPSQLPTEQITRLRTIYRNHAVEKLKQGYDFVVMGHCHDLDEMQFKIGDRCGQYINVGYPRAHRSFLTWEPGAMTI